MSRAAILPFPGDPFLLHYWLHFFDTVWGDEVDKLYIYLNSPIEKPVVDYIRAECAKRPKINLQYLDHMGDHGPAINRTLDIVTEELVVLLEDDGFIFKPGIIDRCFRRIESGEYDVVGSKRGSCASEILIAAKNKWNLDYEGEGDQGPNFWPCYFFCKKELLLSTDRNFAAKAWYKGEYIKELNHTVEGDVIYGDTFVNTSLQIRAIVPQERIYIVPQYHGSPDDIDHSMRSKYLFDGVAPWTHVGSLSSGISGVLRDDQNRALDRRLIDESKGQTQLPREWCTTEAEKNEWERRVQWFDRFWQFYMLSDEQMHLLEFASLYRKAINRIIEQYKLRVDNINHRQKIYAEKLGL